LSVSIFLSAVSDEFYDYREQLRHLLTRPNVAVKIQEDFQDSGTVILDKLDVYITACNAVVHLVGDMTGSAANAVSTVAIAEKYADLVVRVKPLRLPLENRLDISYTQWEAWLALYHSKPLFIAKADDIAPRGPRFDPTDASRVSQRAHLDRLQAAGHYGCTFTNADNLAAHILGGAILDLLASELRAATSTGNVDRNKLEDLQRRLKPIVDSMLEVNAEKKNNVEALRDYVNKISFRSKWVDITQSCKDISTKLQRLLSDLGQNQEQLLDGISFSNAGDLRAALQYQDKIYQWLSAQPEPGTDLALQELITTISRIESLRDQVVHLETSIATYLNSPHVTSP
jgi:hypothetical protein